MTRRAFLRLAGLCGMIAPVLTLGMIFAAMSRAPWFNWHANALSDLGVGSTAGVFNTGLILGGLVNVVFAAGLWLWSPADRVTRVGAGILVLDAIALALIGIFPESVGRLHWLISWIYFLLAALGYVIYGAAALRNRNPVVGLTSIAAGALGLMAANIPPHQGMAVPELIGALIISCWTFAMGTRLVTGP